jgi:hypothetical protein
MFPANQMARKAVWLDFNWLQAAANQAAAESW